VRNLAQHSGVNFLMLEARRSTMRLHAAQHNSCTPVYQPNPNNCLQNTVRNQSDQIGLIVKMADQGIYTNFVRAVMFICDDPVCGPRLSNCWLPAAAWVEALQKTGHIDAAIAIDVRKFKTAMSKAATFGSVMSRFDGSNQSGVFRINYNHQFFFYLANQ
jgi:hypothetical protein